MSVLPRLFPRVLVPASVALLLVAPSTGCNDGRRIMIGEPDAGVPPDGSFFGGACTVDEDCPFNWACNPRGICLERGRCLGDEECPGDLVCGSSSALCIPEDECREDGDCAEGLACNEIDRCTPGGRCGETEFALSPRAPNVLVLLDRSNSMRAPFRSASETSRWVVAKDAIAALVEAFGDQVRFGLAAFSGCTGFSCSPGFIEIEPGDATGQRIQDQLDEWDESFLCSRTPAETSTGLTLYGFREELAITDPSRANYVVLVTDGKESGPCQRIVDDRVIDGAGAARFLLEREIPARTFVIGIGFDDDELDAIARAGGTRESVFATNRNTLTDAFGNVATQAARCSFLLGEAPPDSENLFVFFDGNQTPVPRAEEDGWVYQEAGQLLVFGGEPCRQIQNDEVEQIKVVYGCPGGGRPD
jgi:hypothetical protein